MKKKTFLETKFSVSIIGGSKYFTEYIDLIEKHFLELGHTVNRNMSSGADVYIVINPLFQRYKLNFSNKRSVYACIQTEQLNSPTDKGFLFLNYRMTNNTVIRKLKKFDLVFDWSRSNFNYLNKYIDSVRHLPYTRSEVNDLKESSGNIEYQYDLIFIGNYYGVDNRRKKILDRLKTKYNVYPKHEDLWGIDKINAIQRSKICLNIHYDHSIAFETNRLYEYMSLKKFVISEYIFDSFDLQDGNHFVSFNSIDDLIVKVSYYLENESERDRIANNAYNYLMQNTFNKSFNLLYNSLRVELEDKQIFKFRAIILINILRFIRFSNKFIKSFSRKIFLK
jgi:hypothetical protein